MRAAVFLLFFNTKVTARTRVFAALLNQEIVSIDG